MQPERNWNGHSKVLNLNRWTKWIPILPPTVKLVKSITECFVTLEQTLVTAKSGMQKTVALPVTEAKVIALVMCTQEMLYIAKVLESMELKVEKAMRVFSDNKGAVDLAIGWSVAGNTKHMLVQIIFLRELKESGTLQVEWVSTVSNKADIFTKNVEAKLFQKHVSTFCKNG